MTFELIIRREAQADLADAYAFYEQRREGLGRDFLKELDACFDRLVSLPTAYAVVYRNFRRVRLRRFPYGVVYRIDGQRIVVLAILHDRRSTEAWHRRS